jgi:hypothetical protein
MVGCLRGGGGHGLRLFLYVVMQMATTMARTPPVMVAVMAISSCGAHQRTSLSAARSLTRNGWPAQ